ncbi:MAG: hypothetical protein U5K51_07195 [Flavobacteriaceae bacterium]|nr:hypothetical protein [Flavobacteriaceae bacterium]
MNLERKILEFLYENDNGTCADIAFLDDNFEAIREAVWNLKNENLLVLDENRPRNLEHFGINNNRIFTIKVKINDKGRNYLESLTNSNKSENGSKRRKSFWRFAF